VSPSIFALVLVAAVLHALWNTLVKRASDTLLTAVLVAASAAALGAVGLFFLPPVNASAWPYLLASGALEIVYYCMLAAAYRYADMSRAYPLMRGLPPLLVALASTVVLGVSPTLPEWCGIALISAGILSMLLGGRGSGDGRGIAIAAATALVVSAYTFNDGIGVRLSGAPVTYVIWVFILTGVPLAAWALLRRGAEFRAYFRRNWHYGLVGGFGTLASYGLVLYAMTEAPIALVAALRETSILFVTAIAVFVLKERVTAVRVVAAAIIVSGMVVLRLA
jgi:drug/metabolite transporter (DMT)-like permease